MVDVHNKEECDTQALDTEANTSLVVLRLYLSPTKGGMINKYIKINSPNKSEFAVHVYSHD